ncbi:unnamed protein product [Trichogramma brassicae]|uniref:Uncharacterized protein n=1 Tax=Trichogramma brassicae TaxID=86971 RepID=A0A6H5I180_9HYME|nr:unnamed protein product [Trichogramma brassicae]
MSVRERDLRFLKTAYAGGIIDEYEIDPRVGSGGVICWARRDERETTGLRHLSQMVWVVLLRQHIYIKSPAIIARWYLWQIE